MKVQVQATKRTEHTQVQKKAGSETHPQQY
jgi:hypothetical protein